MALRGNRADNVNTKGFSNMGTSASNSQRTTVGNQGGGLSQVSGPKVENVSNPKGIEPMRIGAASRRSAADLTGQAVDDSTFTTSEGRK